MEQALRKSGIDIIGEAPWGTHFCQFYHTKEDLIDILVPYFKAGLENNEFCMWVTSEPLSVQETKRAMTKAMPNFGRYLESGQIEIIPHTEWYVKGGSFNQERVLNGWVEKLNQALAKGYDGLRLTGNTFWLEKDGWQAFADYEEVLNSVIGNYRMIAICTYSLHRCGASEVIDVVSTHQFALIKRDRKWNLIESSERKLAEQACEEERDKAQKYLDVAGVMFVVINADGKVSLINQKGCEILGYRQEEIIGKNWFDNFLPPRVKNEVLAGFRKLVAGDIEPLEYLENPVLTKSGQERILALHNTLLHGERGEVIATLSSGEDITDRKHAEDRNRTILATALDGYWLADTQGNLLEVNDAYCNLMGYKRDELLSMNVRDIEAAEMAAETTRHIRKVVETGGDRFETRHRAKDGRVIDVEISVNYLDTDNGRFFVFIRDITEQKRAKGALRNALAESEQRGAETAALLESSSAVLRYQDFKDAARAIFDSCKDLIGATAGYVALLSRDGSENEVVFLDSGGLPCTVDPALPMPIRGLRSEAYHTGKAVYHNDFPRSEWVKYMPEGHASLNNVLFAPLVIEGKVEGLVGLANKPGGFTEHDAHIASVFGDIVAVALRNSRLLDLLKNSEERFRSVAESASDAIISVDSAGNTVFWNKAAETIFGYSAGEMIGNPLTIVMPERFQQPHKNGLFRLASRGKSKIIGKTIELVGLGKDGNEFPIELSLSQMKTADGVFFTGIVRDITERKKAEAELAHLASFPELNPSLVLELDTAGNVMYMNPAAKARFPDMPTQGNRHPFLASWETLINTLRSEKSIPFTREINIGDVWYEQTVSSVPSTQNFRLYGGDITERKKAEELSAALGRAVEQDRNTLQATMESTNAHIAYLGPDFNFIMVNSTYEAGSGHTRGELIGHNHFKFFPNPENEAIFKKARDTGKAVEFKAKPFEFVDQPWRGVTYWDWTLTPVKDELGGVRGLVLSLIDVTVDIRKKQLSDALNDINAVINSTLDFNEVMERVVIDSAKAMRVESAIIALRKGEHWTVKHNYKYPGKIAGVKIADEEMPHMWLAANIKKPVVINDIYTDERVDPKVMETFGLRSVLVLPLVLKEEVIGIISFNYHSGAVTFGDNEVEFTNKLGASVTLAIQNARLYEAEYHIAEALQESLIRPVPKISGLKIGVVYEPAFETEKVGGDFYDIFELEGSLACVLIGDVSGKGVAAAGLTETVRSSVRTLAYVKPSPSFVLGRADQALARQILPEQFVTAVFLVINTETGEILVANAGHPSAALCGSKCTLVDLPLGFPLGLSMGEYEESCLKLREKQTLILYTDGLTEARRGARAFGEGGLLKTLSAIISSEPQNMAEGLLESATAFAEGKLVDDIVVVALRLSKSGNAQPVTRLLKNENH